MKTVNIFSIVFLITLIIGFGKSVNAQSALFSDISSSRSGRLNNELINQQNNVTYQGQVGPDHGRFNYVAFDPLNEGVVFASAFDGRQIFKSNDGGETWVHFYSAPQVLTYYPNISKLKFANPQEPSHLYFIVSSSAGWDVDARGLYILDVATGNVVNVIKVFHHWHLEIFDYDVCADLPKNIIIFTKMGDSFPIPEYWTAVWKTEDNGNTIELIYEWMDHNYMHPNVVRIHPNNPDIILMGMSYGWLGINGGFYRSDDGGRSWVHLAYEDTFGDLVFCSNDSKRVYAITGFDANIDEEEGIERLPKLFTSEDTGLSWTEININIEPSYHRFNCFSSITVNPSNTNNIWITHESEIFFSNDGGGSWQNIPFSYDDMFYYYGIDININPFNSENIIITSDFRTIKTENGGITWENVANQSLVTFRLSAVEYPNGNQFLFYASDGSYFIHNLQDGSIEGDWAYGVVGVHYFIFGDNYTQNRVFLAKPDDGYYNGLTIYKTNDFFETEPQQIYYDNSVGLLRRIVRAPEDENTYWFITQYNDADDLVKLMRTSNNFESTKRLSITGQLEDITSLAVVENLPGVLWAYAYSEDFAGVYKSYDYGDSWTSYSNGLPEGIGIWSIAVNPNNPNNLLASVSMDRGIYVTFDGGGNWHPSFTGFECTDIVFSKKNPNIVFAKRFLYPGLIYSLNGGFTWNELPADLMIDADYGNLVISDNEGTIDLLLTAWGIGISKYTFLVPESYSATFNVIDAEGMFISDATIKLNGFAHEPGEYLISDLYPAPYSINVSKDGYLPFIGELVITDYNVEVTVTLENSPTVKTPVNQYDMLELFPNPAKNFLNLQSIEQVKGYKIINLTGQVVMQSNGEIANLPIDVTSLDNGLFLIQITTKSGKSVTKKFIISK